ncbi:SHOCT domain-containing protein [Flavobacterium gelidilacus]|uniref:SHOCT domain-containing protein n=1 Tax=Flavobacterium gelidilacus TaxID=206041 RepID=UPI0004233D31|nr:SHOCT domain-containing protein [Flavobacterium gelidilacus]
MKNSAKFALISISALILFYFTDILTFLPFFIFLLISLIITAFWSSNETKEENNNYKEKAKKVLDELKDFEAENITLSDFSGMSVAFDNNRKKICFVDAVYKPWIYNFSDILESEIVIDGQTVTKKSGTIGRSVVGGILAGGAGAIIGGTTGSTTTNEKINSILVKITINNTINPIFKIIFLNTTIEKNSILYTIPFTSSEKLHGIIAGFIKQTENKKNEPKENNLTISDELIKLKKLVDDGILNDEEFQIQKKKLLDKN